MAARKKGQYSTSSLYHVINFRGIQPIYPPVVWKLKVPPKIHVFLWLLSNNKLMTRDNLRKRHIIKPLDCVYCCCDESIHHLFFDCVVAKNLWSFVSSQFSKAVGYNFESVAKFWISEKSNSAFNVTSSAVLWCLWKHRNSMIFNNVGWPSMNQVWRDILRTLKFWVVLSSGPGKDRLEIFICSLEQMTRQPQSIPGG